MKKCSAEYADYGAHVGRVALTANTPTTRPTRPTQLMGKAITPLMSSLQRCLECYLKT